MTDHCDGYYIFVSEVTLSWNVGELLTIVSYHSNFISILRN